MKHGKKYVDAAKLVDRTKLYDTNEAQLSRLQLLSLTKQLSFM